MTVDPGWIFAISFLAGVAVGAVLGIILSPWVMDRYVNRGRVVRPTPLGEDKVWITGEEPEGEEESELYDPNAGLPRY